MAASGQSQVQSDPVHAASSCSFAFSLPSYPVLAVLVRAGNSCGELAGAQTPCGGRPLTPEPRLLGCTFETFSRSPLDPSSDLSKNTRVYLKSTEYWVVCFTLEMVLGPR